MNININLEINYSNELVATIIIQIIKLKIIKRIRESQRDQVENIVQIHKQTKMKNYKDVDQYTVYETEKKAKVFTNEPEDDYLESAQLSLIKNNLEETASDIFLFQTGQEEIEIAFQLLHERTKKFDPDDPELIILPNYSTLPTELQQTFLILLIQELYQSLLMDFIIWLIQDSLKSKYIIQNWYGFFIY